MSPIPVTPEGYNQLLQKMQQLKEQDFAKNQEEIRYFTKEGNLTENLGYQNALAESHKIDRKIVLLKDKINNCHIINNSHYKGKKIKFGCTIKLKDEDGFLKTYTLVGSEESDIAAGKISIHSPIGEALVDQKVGDFIEIYAPRGDIKYEIVEIKYNNT